MGSFYLLLFDILQFADTFFSAHLKAGDTSGNKLDLFADTFFSANLEAL